MEQCRSVRWGIFVLLAALFPALYRLTLYRCFGVAAGEAYGLGDVLELLFFVGAVAILLLAIVWALLKGSWAMSKRKSAKGSFLFAAYCFALIGVCWVSSRYAAQQLDFSFCR